MPKEQLEAKLLKHYLEVIILDVARHQSGLAENLTAEMMSQRSLKLKKITKRIQLALDTKSKKAKLKNEVPPEEGLYSGIEGNDLYAAIKAESNNTFNPIWIKSLNKNGDMPSGVQLDDVLNTVRKEVFDMKDITRRSYLAISRKKSAAKKAAQPGTKANDIDEEKDRDDNDDEHPPGEEIAVSNSFMLFNFSFFIVDVKFVVNVILPEFERESVTKPTSGYASKLHPPPFSLVAEEWACLGQPTSVVDPRHR